MIFSERMEAAKDAEKWCLKNGFPNQALFVVLALNALGYFDKKPKEIFSMIDKIGFALMFTIIGIAAGYAWAGMAYGGP